MMRYHVVTWFCVVVAACAPSDDPTGTIVVNLKGQGESGTVYRLRDAVITVQGPSYLQDWNTEDDPDRVALSADVGGGDYTALLHDGWHLERLDGAAALAVSAELVSDNPAQFTVTTLHRTSVALQFRVDGDVVDLSQGYDITIGVREGPSLAIANQGDRFPPNVAVFSARSAGAVSPLRTIAGPSTQLGITGSIAFANNQLVMANLQPPTINFYAATARGDAAPIRQITDISTPEGNGPFDIQVSGGEVYVSVAGDVDVFPLGAAGPVPPTRKLEGLVGLQRFAIDQGELYATSLNFENLGISVYQATVAGAQQPSRTLAVTDPQLCPLGIAVHGDLIYAADICNVRVVVLPKTASGTVAPVRVIAGPTTGLHSPWLLAIFGDELYVLDAFSSDNQVAAVRVYPLDADGDVAPTRTITSTALARPLGIAVF